MKEKVYCSECRFCYRANLGYTSLNYDEYRCCNTKVITFEEYVEKSNPLQRPTKEIKGETRCIKLNEKHNCDGFEKLEVEKVPVKFLGIQIGTKEITNKVIEDYSYGYR